MFSPQLAEHAVDDAKINVCRFSSCRHRTSVNCLHFLYSSFRFPPFIQQVKSRTKEFAYGLYWKHNRKNCIAFLSLDTQRSMDAHMRWVDCQIQTLETYRKGKLTIDDDVNHSAILGQNVRHELLFIVISYPTHSLLYSWRSKHVNLRHKF